MYPTVLVIDADERRSQLMGRLLTLTGYRPLLAARPYDAFERALQENFTPQAIFLGQPEIASDHLLHRLLQHFAYRPPLFRFPAHMIETLPLSADPSLPSSHRFSQASVEVLEALWRISPLNSSSMRRTQSSLVLTKLPKSGLQPRISRLLRSRNSHFRQILKAAYDLIGDMQWKTLITDVGLAQYIQSSDWPTDTNERTIPPEYLSYLNQAVAFSRPDNPTKQLRQWATQVTDLSLQKRTPSAVTQQLLKLLSVDRVMSAVLNAYTEEMNEIRGEELHIWKRQSDGCYWLVNYSNLYVYGRVWASQPACHVWEASLERTLHLVGLDATWKVTEIECSCQTLTGHCLFSIKPR